MGIEVLVEGEGLKDVELVELPTGSTAREIILAAAAKGGFPADEAVLFLEDGDEPLDLTVLLEETRAGKIHHVHRVRNIDVVAYYKDQSIERRFRTSARVQRVLDWAVGPEGFKNIDPPIIPEMELALHNTATALPKNAHIGRYVRHHQHRLEFDLIRGVIPNGAP